MKHIEIRDTGLMASAKNFLMALSCSVAHQTFTLNF